MKDVILVTFGVIILVVFVLGYMCGFVDTMNLSKHIEVPKFHLETKYGSFEKDGNVIIRRHNDHKTFDEFTITDDDCGCD